jgi:outer membrane lipoprotein carrier protein
VAPIALLLVASSGSPGDENAELLASVQARYDTVKDLSAVFVQKSTVASLGREETARGRVWVKRPGRMRWEYETPEPRVIAVDGETVRIWLPSDKQMQIAPLSAGAFSPTALGFLLGTGDLSETFDAERLDDGPEGQVRMRLRPREDARFSELELWVAPGTHQLRGSVLVDVLGNRTEVRFQDVSENEGLTEAHFTIEVPADTEVIDLR